MKLRILLISLLLVSSAHLKDTAAQDDPTIIILVGDHSRSSLMINNTNISVISYPERVRYGERFSVSGELFIDRDSDGIYGIDDEYLNSTWIEVLWQEGTPNSDYHIMRTGKGPTAGQFSLELTANEPDVHLNGEQGMELSVRFPGIYTYNGSTFHNLTDDLYSKMRGAIPGIDDDNDSAVLQTNGIDDDGDGTVDDGRKEILAVGDPESPENLTNGIDDDGDGTVDDGSPAIPVVGIAEGIDEEIPNGRDDDGDGEIDEDTPAYIVNTPVILDIYIEVWHRTSVSFYPETPTIYTAGETKNVMGKMEDLSYSFGLLGTKSIQIHLDGVPVILTHCVPATGGYHSEFEAYLNIPKNTTAGIHSLTVSFDPSYNLTNNNYFEPSSKTIEIRVRRPLIVIFNDLDESGQRSVRRNGTIDITGRVIDRFLYEEEGILKGPGRKISDFDYTGSYTLTLTWGHGLAFPSKRVFENVVLNDKGSFSVDFHIQDAELSIGMYTIHVSTTLDQDPYLYPFMYYTNAENHTYYNVITSTRIEIWLDQNENGVNDLYDLDYGDDPLDSFMTNFNYDPLKDGNKWNTARIRGKVILDDSSTYSDYEDLKSQRVRLLWNFGSPKQVTYTIAIRDEGEFWMDREIFHYDRIGPVIIHTGLTIPETGSNFDHPSFDYPRRSFNIMARSSLSIKRSDDDMTIELTDDDGEGLAWKRLDLYTFPNVFDTVPNEDDIYRYGDRIDIVETNESGAFKIDNWKERFNIRHRTLIVVFNGSLEYPKGNDSYRFAPGDAYLPVISAGFDITQKADTYIELDSPVQKIIHGDRSIIQGSLMNNNTGKGINNAKVEAYLIKDSTNYRISSTTTLYSEGGGGFFRLEVDMLPSRIGYGEAELAVVFDPEEQESFENSLEGCRISRIISIVYTTGFNERIISLYDEDIPPDGRLDLYREDADNITFRLSLRANETGPLEYIPVSNVLIQVEFIMVDWYISMNLTSDPRGWIEFGFPDDDFQWFIHPHMGDQFDYRSSNLTLKLTFHGSDYFLGSNTTYDIEVHREIDPYKNPIIDEGSDRATSIIPFVLISISFILLICLAIILKVFINRRRDQDEE